jgi:hypothetical protein
MLIRQLAHFLLDVYQPQANSSEQYVCWMSCTGNGEAVDPLILKGVRGEVVCDEQQQLTILHHHLTKWYPLFALCNVSEKEKMFVIETISSHLEVI